MQATEKLIPLTKIQGSIAELREENRVLNIEAKRILETNAALELANARLVEERNTFRSATRKAEVGRQFWSDEYDDLNECAEKVLSGDLYASLWCVSCEDRPKANPEKHGLCRACEMTAYPEGY